jgi:hypothetical protein
MIQCAVPAVGGILIAMLGSYLSKLLLTKNPSSHCLPAYTLSSPLFLFLLFALARGGACNFPQCPVNYDRYWALSERSLPKPVMAGPLRLRVA